MPAFLDILGPAERRTQTFMTTLLGLTLIAITLTAVETALGLVFDGRWRDFPFAALTMAVVPFTTLSLLTGARSGGRPIAEVVFASLLALTAVYICFNEGFANWQSLWTCAIYLLLGFTLLQAREGKSSSEPRSEVVERGVRSIALRRAARAHGLIPIFSLIAPSSVSSQMPIRTPFFTCNCWLA